MRFRRHHSRRVLLIGISSRFARAGAPRSPDQERRPRAKLREGPRSMLILTKPGDALYLPPADRAHIW